MKHVRGDSFAHIDELTASKVLEDLLKENDVLLGGASMGKGLARAARYHLRKLKANQAISENQDDVDLFDEAYQPVPEDPFYIVDLGVVVSQLYQWRKCLPRVQPFFAVKSNPDPVIVRTLAILGCSFDCASRKEIEIVQQQSKGLAVKPDIIYANPCKGRGHVADAIRRGVRLMTFDNIPEVQKCAAVSKKIKLILRIITDDRGSQCRLSSKFGAPKHKWRSLLQAVKDNGLECCGVSFHVGSGCRDASRYEAALRDARTVFDMAESEFGYKMTIVDIGGGFPGETHSMWNPSEYIDAEEDEEVKEDEEEAKDEGREASQESLESDGDHFLFFTEIAELVSPLIDQLFPEEHIRVIGEPGRYLVAAASTLVASVIGARNNAMDDNFKPEPIDDREAAAFMNEMTRDDEKKIVHARGMSFSGESPLDQSSKMMESIVEEFNDYSKLFAKQHLVQQEADVYNDGLDFYQENFATASNVLGPPESGDDHKLVHTAEGVNVALATDTDIAGDAMMALAAAGEAAVKGVVLQAVADVAPLQDDYAYYINDGTYGAFNNIMFDHATVRPRQLKNVFDDEERDVVRQADASGFSYLKDGSHGGSGEIGPDKTLYASTVFGPTCDSIDVIARSVLLPKLQIGDWLYFQNMGAYTSAAASAFNGFQPAEKKYVCSVKTKFFEQLIAGPELNDADEEKKED